MTAEKMISYVYGGSAAQVSFPRRKPSGKEYARVAKEPLSQTDAPR